jgi:lambda family phage portal protein
MSSFVSAVLRTRALDRYDEAELQAAIQNAIMATAIESPFDEALVDSMLAPADPDDDARLSAYQEFRVAYHETADIRLGGENVVKLAPGEKIIVNRAERPSGNFAAFEGAVLRSIAAPLGLTYEQMSRDWSQVNYSSARAALIEVWRGFTAERELFTQHVLTPLYCAWLEEAVARGYVEVPGGAMNFYRYRTALTSCDWVGPGRGWVDPKKEAEASALRTSQYLTSPSQEAAEQGVDFIRTVFQAGRDRREIMKQGLPDPYAVAEAAAQPH